jgi:hypothetical protein
VTDYETGLVGHHTFRGDVMEPDPLIMDERFVAAHVRGRGITVLSACSHAGVCMALRQKVPQHRRPRPTVGRPHPTARERCCAGTAAPGAYRSFDLPHGRVRTRRKEMTQISVLWSMREPRVYLGLAAAIVMFAAGSAFAKTPDGMPPSQETVCSGLTGAAFGLCNAYCEAQDCDVHPRPSCPVLRRNFQRITGSPVFPCDRRCGNGMLDPGEQCDPAGVPCVTGLPCLPDCTCEEVLVCCECVGTGTTAPVCQDGVPLSACATKPGCAVGPPGSSCNPEFGRCLLQEPSCCLCPNGCMTVPSPELCPPDCFLGTPPSMCDADGNCQQFPVPVP